MCWEITCASQGASQCAYIPLCLHPALPTSRFAYNPICLHWVCRQIGTLKCTPIV